MASCAPLQYYQVCKTEVSDEMQVGTKSIIYEDGNCTVAYDLWSQGGNPGFYFRNNTNEDIYLHLDKSFFVKNGVAYDYYLDRIISTTNQTTVSASNRIGTSGLMNTSGEAQNRREKEVITIPANTRKKISEYSVSWLRITHCDLPSYPTRMKIKTKAFDKENSPMVFSNRIAYSKGNAEEVISFENEFYVSEVTNYPEQAMFENRSVTYCEGRAVSRRFMKYVSPDAYFLKYNTGER